MLSQHFTVGAFFTGSEGIFSIFAIHSKRTNQLGFEKPRSIYISVSVHEYMKTKIKSEKHEKEKGIKFDLKNKVIN